MQFKYSMVAVPTCGGAPRPVLRHGEAPRSPASALPLGTCDHRRLRRARPPARPLSQIRNGDAGAPGNGGDLRARKRGPARGNDRDLRIRAGEELFLIISL
jgi:hypothetical protein